MTTLTKTPLNMTTPTGITYPIYYDEITERYFIKRFALWLEVVYRNGGWVQGDNAMKGVFECQNPPNSAANTLQMQDLHTTT